jgi:hypothetical protein
LGRKPRPRLVRQPSQCCQPRHRNRHAGLSIGGRICARRGRRRGQVRVVLCRSNDTQGHPRPNEAVPGRPGGRQRRQPVKIYTHRSGRSDTFASSIPARRRFGHNRWPNHNLAQRRVSRQWLSKKFGNGCAASQLVLMIQARHGRQTSRYDPSCAWNAVVTSQDDEPVAAYDVLRWSPSNPPARRTDVEAANRELQDAVCATLAGVNFNASSATGSLLSRLASFR